MEEAEDKTILEQVSDISELNEIRLYFQSDDVDEALSTLVRLITKPNVPPAVAAPLVVKLQALSSQFRLMGKVHMLYDTEETKEAKSRKKNTFMTLAEELEKLANAVKYLVKT